MAPVSVIPVTTTLDIVGGVESVVVGGSVGALAGTVAETVKLPGLSIATAIFPRSPKVPPIVISSDPALPGFLICSSPVISEVAFVPISIVIVLEAGIAPPSPGQIVNVNTSLATETPTCSVPEQLAASVRSTPPTAKSTSVLLILDVSKPLSKVNTIVDDSPAPLRETKLNE